MPDKGNKVLKYNYREKSLKAPFMIYSDLDSLFTNFLFDVAKKCLIVTMIVKIEAKIVRKSFVKI